MTPGSPDSASPWNLAPTLTSPALVIQPLTEDKLPLYLSLLDPEIFRYYPFAPARHDLEGLADYWRLRTSMGIHFLLVSKAEDGTPVACSSYMDIREEHRGLEIGHTQIRLDHRGTYVNPEMKRMMLAYAFEQLGCRRVQLKCDADNKRSFQAILKIGATHEGVMRSNALLASGRWRSTALFSILDDEWPEIKLKLAKSAAERGLPTV